MLTACFSTVAEVGFDSSMYTVTEGDETMVTLCVEIFSGELTNVVSLSYLLSLQPDTASGNIAISYDFLMSWYLKDIYTILSHKLYHFLL